MQNRAARAGAPPVRRDAIAAADAVGLGRDDAPTIEVHSLSLGQGSRDAPWSQLLVELEVVLAWVVLEAIGWLWIASTTSPRARTSSYAAPSARRGKSMACIQHVGMDSDRDFSAAPERSRAAGAVPRVGRRQRQEYSRAAHTGNQKRVSERVCQPYLMARGSCHGERLRRCARPRQATARLYKWGCRRGCRWRVSMSAFV